MYVPFFVFKSQTWQTDLIEQHINDCQNISVWEGTYDLVTKTITLDYVEQTVPGIKTQIRQVLVLRDKDHYAIEYFNVLGRQHTTSQLKDRGL